MNNASTPRADSVSLGRCVKSRSNSALAGWLTLLCLALSILVFLGIATAHHSQRQTEIVSIAEDLAVKLTTQFSDYMDVLTASERFVMASDSASWNS